MKKFLLVLSVICTLAFTGCKKNDEIIVPEDNQNSTTNEIINSGENSGEAINDSISEEIELDEEIANAYTQIITENITEYESADKEYKFDFIYFNNDDIPDLVIDYLGYNADLYVWNPVEKVAKNTFSFSYGAFGRTQCLYHEKASIVEYTDTDYAGALFNRNILGIDDNGEIVTNLTIIGEGASIEDALAEETDEDLKQFLQDAKKAIEENAGHYINGQKVTEDEYNAEKANLKLNEEMLELTIGYGENGYTLEELMGILGK